MLTQGLIAGVLDVRRESLTEAANKLQNDGVIRYSNRHIEVLNRHGLEQNICECCRQSCHIKFKKIRQKAVFKKTVVLNKPRSGSWIG